MGFDQSAVEEIDGKDISPGSVDTTDVATSNISAGSTGRLIHAAIGAFEDVELTTQHTSGVSTTAAAVLVPTANAHLAVVTGVQDGASSTRFLDIVSFFAFGGGATAIQSESNGSPDGRTYSVDSDALDLAMAANTYNVTTISIGASGSE